MACFIYKIYEDGTSKVYEDGAIRKIYEQLGDDSCLKCLLIEIKTILDDLDFDSFLSVAPQNQDYPIITVNILSLDNVDDYIKKYYFSLEIYDINMLNTINISAAIESEMEAAGCIHMYNETGPIYVNQKHFNVTKWYNYICDVSGLEN